MEKNKKYIGIAIICLIFFSICFSGGKEDKLAKDLAITEIKGVVYDITKELPEQIQANIIYDNGKDFIVVVRFKSGDVFKGSYACHIIVNSSKYGYVQNRTNGTVNYDYLYDVEKLKASFRIE